MNKRIIKIMITVLLLTVALAVTAYAASGTTVSIGFDVVGDPGTVTMKPLNGAPAPETGLFTGVNEGKFTLNLPSYGNYSYEIAQSGNTYGIAYDARVYVLEIFWGLNKEETNTQLVYSLRVKGADPHDYPYKPEEAHFINGRYGQLTITNDLKGAEEVTNLNGSTEKVINSFTVSFTPADPEDPSFFEHKDGCYIYDENGVKHELTKNADGSYTATVGLGKKESVTFPGLPEGTKYTAAMVSQDNYELTDVTGSQLNSSGTINGRKETDGAGKVLGWTEGEIACGVKDQVTFQVKAGYSITLTQMNQTTGEWLDQTTFEFVQNFSYLRYVTQGQNLTDEGQNLRVAVQVGTYTAPGDATRYLNVESIDGVPCGDFFKRYTSDSGVQTAAAADTGVRGVSNDGKDCGWTYYPDDHAIVFDAEWVEPGGVTSEHVILASVPAVNRQTDFTGDASLLPDDSDEKLAEAEQVKSTAYAEWLRVLVYIGDQNEPEEWQTGRDIKFKVRLKGDSPEFDPNNVHYKHFLSESAYGAGEGKECKLDLTRQDDGSYTGEIILTHGERVVFYDLHEGDGYTVTSELTDTQGNRYAVYKAGTDDIIGKTVDMAIFRLIPVHDVSITKETAGVADAANKEYSFDLKLDVRTKFKDVNGKDLMLDMDTVDFDELIKDDQVEYDEEGGIWEGVVTLNGAGDGNTVRYSNIPDGSTYTITELDESAKGHKTTMTVTTQQTITDQYDEEKDIVTPAKPVVTGPFEGTSIDGMFNKLNIAVTFENTAQYDLTYDLNGGNVNGSTADVSESYTHTDTVADVNKAGPTPKRDGYAFGGWSETKHEAGLTEKPGDIVTGGIDFTKEDNWHDIRLYAVWARDDNGNGIPDWDEEHYTLHYDANGGTGAVPADKTVVTDVTVELENKPLPTKPGAVWVGWSATEHTDLFTDKESVESAVITSVVMDGDKTVYAMWAVDANGNGIPDYEEEPEPTPTPTPAPTAKPNGPKTGDEANLGLWAALLGASALAICGGGIWWFLLAKKKKKKDEEENLK